MLKIITEKRYKELLKAEEMLGGWRPSESSIISSVSTSIFGGKHAHDMFTASGEAAFLNGKIEDLEKELRQEKDFKWDAQKQLKILQEKEEKRVSGLKRAERELEVANLKAELDEKAPLGMSFDCLGDLHIVVEHNLASSYVLTQYTSSSGDLVIHKWAVDTLFGFFCHHNISGEDCE